MEPGEESALGRVVAWALAEDVGTGDITTMATVPTGLRARALMVAREPLVVAGLAVVEEVFRQVSPVVHVERLAREGGLLGQGGCLVRVEGPAGALLTAERVALNFAQRLCGVATMTHEYVAAVAGTQAVILDTRKTTPGLRALEKAAVVAGGGCSHRLGLFDAILIKDNHLASLREARPNAIAAAVARVRERFPGRTVEVEADTLEQVEQAVAAGAEVILLDNMPVETLRAAVVLVAGRARTEASGGVHLGTVRAIAETGVDYISVGALTHSARAMDIGLDFESGGPASTPAKA